MKINMRDWMRGIANSSQRQALPIMTYPGLQLIHKNILEVIKDGPTQYASIKALADKYPSAAAVTIMDLSVEAEAFGSPVNFSEQDVPTVASRIITDLESVQKLEVPAVGCGRTGVYIKAAELASRGITNRPTFGGMIGPFSLAGRLFDMTEIMMALVLDPDIVHLVLKKCTQFLTQYARSFKEAGANGIIIAEPAAGLISPAQCDEFSSRYIQSIIENVQDEAFMVILHNCGNTKPLVPSLLSTGAMGFHFGNAVRMNDILPQIPWGRMALGNIDPASIFKNGTQKEMETKVWDLLQQTAPYKNYVLSSGCDVPPGTPIENVEAFYRTLDRFNQTNFSNKVVNF